MENQKDHTPWLRLIIIHRDYQGYGFGSQGYGHYKKEMVERGANRIHLSINKENAKAQSFFGNH
jgi:ribosomal protein S18 acetylase RimI-like enzyme